MSDVSDVYFPINYKVLNLINYFRLFHIHIAIKSISYLGSHPEMFCKLQFLKISQNSLENTCAKSAGHGLQLYEKETPAQVVSSEFCGIFNNTYF